MLTFQSIKSAFNRKGIEILPVDSAGLAELERIFHGKLPNEVRSYFELFNGFVDCSYDPRSMIELWSVNKVISWSVEQASGQNLLTLPLGDFFIEAELIMSDISKPQCPVFFNERRERIANSPKCLLEGILAGRFDLDGD